MNQDLMFVDISSSTIRNLIFSGILRYFSTGRESFVFEFNNFFIVKTFIILDRFGKDMCKNSRILKSIYISNKIKSNPMIVLDMGESLDMFELSKDVGNLIYNSPASDVRNKDFLLSLCNSVANVKRGDICYISRYIVINLKYQTEMYNFCKQSMKLSDILDISYQLLLRLKELKDLSVLHRDIKDDNIMISCFIEQDFDIALKESLSGLIEYVENVENKDILFNKLFKIFYNKFFFKYKFYVTFIDFGYSCVESNYINNEKQYLDRFSCVNDTFANFGTDLYATMIIIYQMIIGSNMSDKINIPRTYDSLMHMINQIYIFNNGNNEILRHLCDFLYGGINQNPNNRYTVEDCLNSDLMIKYYNIYEEEYKINRICNIGYVKYYYLTPNIMQSFCDMFYKIYCNRNDLDYLINLIIYTMNSYHIRNMTHYSDFNYIPYYIKFISISYICMIIHCGDIIDINLFFNNFIDKVTDTSNEGIKLNKIFKDEFRSLDLCDWFDYVIKDVINDNIFVNVYHNFEIQSYQDICELLQLHRSKPRGYINI